VTRECKAASSDRAVIQSHPTRTTVRARGSGHQTRLVPGTVPGARGNLPTGPDAALGGRDVSPEPEYGVADRSLAPDLTMTGHRSAQVRIRTVPDAVSAALAQEHANRGRRGDARGDARVDAASRGFEAPTSAAASPMTSASSSMTRRLSNGSSTTTPVRATGSRSRTGTASSSSTRGPPPRVPRRARRPHDLQRRRDRGHRAALNLSAIISSPSEGHVWKPSFELKPRVLPETRRFTTSLQ
jgi:hypothetical protein